MLESHTSLLVYNNSIDSATNLKLHPEVKIPYFYLYADHIVIYPQRDTTSKAPQYNIKSIDNLKKEKFTGTISDSAVRMIKQRVTSWLKSIQVYNNQATQRYKRKTHYPVFITLTLSGCQIHSDNWIKRNMLGYFIKKLQREFDIDNYFWRAEKQKNGNIHFHLLIDKYIPFNQLRLMWNSIQAINGYLDSFKIEYKHDNPNSVDIRSAETVKHFINYALKYMVKNDDGIKVDGRIWGMSDRLKNLATYKDIISGNINTEIDKCVERDEVRLYKGEYFTVIYFEKAYYNSKLNAIMEWKSNNYYLNVYDMIYNTDNEPVEIILDNPPEHPPGSEQLEIDIAFPVTRPDYDFYTRNKLD